jgi:hypothetical protein
MIKWEQNGPLHDGLLGNIVVVDVFDGPRGAAWSVLGIPTGRGKTPYFVHAPTVDEAKAAAEAYVAAWMSDAGVVKAGGA